MVASHKRQVRVHLEIIPPQIEVELQGQYGQRHDPAHSLQYPEAKDFFGRMAAQKSGVERTGQGNKCDENKLVIKQTGKINNREYGPVAAPLYHPVDAKHGRKHEKLVPYPVRHHLPLRDHHIVGDQQQATYQRKQRVRDFAEKMVGHENRRDTDCKGGDGDLALYAVRPKRVNQQIEQPREITLMGVNVGVGRSRKPVGFIRKPEAFKKIKLGEIKSVPVRGERLVVVHHVRQEVRRCQQPAEDERVCDGKKDGALHVLPLRLIVAVQDQFDAPENY